MTHKICFFLKIHNVESYGVCENLICSFISKSLISMLHPSFSLLFSQSTWKYDMKFISSSIFLVRSSDCPMPYLLENILSPSVE